MALTLSVGRMRSVDILVHRKCRLRKGTNREPWLVIDIKFPPAYSILPKAEDQSDVYKTR